MAQLATRSHPVASEYGELADLASPTSSTDVRSSP